MFATRNPGAAPGPVSFSASGGDARDKSSGVWAWWIVGVALAVVAASAAQILFRSTEQGLFVPVASFMLCAAGAAVDTASRRIPNLLTYPAILLALAINVLLVPLLERLGGQTALAWLGSPGAKESLLGFGLCALIGILAFMARGLGGGDVKLLGALGALIGLGAVIPVLLNTLVIAAIIGVINWTVRGELVARVQVVALGLLNTMFTKRGLAKAYPFRRTEAPFGVSLLLGLVSAQFIAVHQLVLSLMR